MAFAVSLFPVAVGAVTNFTYDTTVTYAVSSDGTTNVHEHYSITNNTARQYLTELKLQTPVETLSDLKVSYSDGGAITATTAKRATVRDGLSYDYAEIDIMFPRQTYGSGRVWEFDLTYSAKGLVDSRGGGHTVFIPSIEAGDSGDAYKVTLEVPESFGTAHFSGAKSASGGLLDGKQFFNFDKADLLAHSLALVFGDSTIYRVNMNYPLTNDGPLAKTFTISLPPDLNNQHAVVTKLTPEPLNTRLDPDGNVLADYRLKAGEHLTVKTDIESEVKYLEYDTTKSKKLANIPAELVRQYTSSSRFWQTGGVVGEAAKKLNDPNAPVIDNVKAMYQFVVDRLTYNKNKIQFNYRQGATKAFTNPTNVVCLEYADLLIAMLRSQGIPARMPIGYAYSGGLKNTDSVADSLHAWVEAYVPGVGWMTLDPTWGKKFDNFGKSDMDHVAFAVWGTSDELPGAVMAGGSDTGYQYESAVLDYTTKLSLPTGSAKVNFQRYLILPFVSYDRVTTESLPGVASDGNVLQLEGRTVQLGSLAPSQKTKQGWFNVGLRWSNKGTIKFGRTSAGGLGVLAQASAKVIYWPLFVFLGCLVFAAIAAAVVRLLPRKNKPGLIASDDDFAKRNAA